MVKVNQRIGAVAVYSPLRVGVIVVAIVAVLLAAGFGLAQLVDGEPTEAQAQAQPAKAVTATTTNAAERRRLVAAEARVERVLARLAQVRADRRRILRRVRRLATADAGSARLATGRPYIVILRKGTGGADYVIGPRSAMERGMSYRPCPDGGGICVRPDGGR